jgi:dihydrofolate synthase/folylpolyglutamate synthase
MTYKDAITYLNSFVNYEQLSSYDYKTSFKLERALELFALLDNPENNIKTIHLTGTKGKGSTAAMTASILEAAGMKVGLYTSPHLVSFRERIKINGSDITEDDVAQLTEEVKAAVDRSQRTDFTFFELYTALAFLYFKRENVDYAVVEVGLGGRLDATNVIRPLVTCITPISLEHTQYLGSTLEEIAREKAAIIKRGCVCISGPQPEPVREIIRSATDQEGVRLFEVGNNIFYESLGIHDRREVFSVVGIYGEYGYLTMGLAGEHQIVNAAAAIGIVEALRFHDIVITATAIREGFNRLQWPGRLEVAGEQPLIILDAAQNKASAAALSNAVTRAFRYSRLILILGISSDKDIPGVCGVLERLSDEIILTKADNVRAKNPSELKEYFHKPVHLTACVADALTRAKMMASADDLILITGSFFVIGEAKEKLSALPPLEAETVQ